MEYDKKTDTGWIEDQFILKGNYIEKNQDWRGYGIYLKENNVLINVSKESLGLLKQMIKEFSKKMRDF